MARLTHQEIMHNSIGSNGISMPSNWVQTADGVGGVSWNPMSGGGGGASFGSNATDVSSTSAVGGSGNSAREDHVHRGVHEVTSNSSNALFGDVNLQAGSSIALGVSGQTITITNIGSGSGGGGGGGGSAATMPTVYQAVSNGNAATTLTIAAAASGHRLVLFTNSTTGQITSPTCTNVTWTQLVTHTGSGGGFYALWVGVVAGGSSGTTITVTLPGSFNSMCAIEVGDALTPTAAHSTHANWPNTTSYAAPNYVTLSSVTSGHFLAYAAGSDNTTVVDTLFPAAPASGIAENSGVTLLVGYASTTIAGLQGWITGAGSYIICEIT